MDWCVLEERYPLRIAAFRCLDELEANVDRIVEEGGLSLLFDEGRRYGDGHIFVSERVARHLPHFVPEEGILAASIGLVTPCIEQPQFHAIERVDGQLVIAGQSPLAFTYGAFVARYRDLLVETSAYVRSLRALRA